MTPTLDVAHCSYFTSKPCLGLMKWDAIINMSLFLFHHFLCHPRCQSYLLTTLYTIHNFNTHLICTCLMIWEQGDTLLLFLSGVDNIILFCHPQWHLKIPKNKKPTPQLHFRRVAPSTFSISSLQLWQFICHNIFTFFLTTFYFTISYIHHVLVLMQANLILPCSTTATAPHNVSVFYN